MTSVLCVQLKSGMNELHRGACQNYVERGGSLNT